MRKVIKIILALLVLTAVVCTGFIIVNKNKSSSENQNSKLIYETSISPNENFVDKDEDKIFFTIKIYQEKDKIKVCTSSNSEFSEDISYDVKTDEKITKNDINVEWQTLMGSTDFTEDNQLSVALITLSKDGKVISQRKVNFVTKAIEIVADSINNNKNN